MSNRFTEKFKKNLDLPGQAGNKVFPAEKDNGSCEKKNAPFSCNGTGCVKAGAENYLLTSLKLLTVNLKFSPCL